MQQFTSSKAKQNFGELLKAIEQGPVAIERHNKVHAIVSTPGQFANQGRQPDIQAERKLARISQAMVEKDRLIKHHKIALGLLTLPPSQRKVLIDQAKSMVDRWRNDQLCSAEYIDRWSTILSLSPKDIAQAIVADNEGWGNALRQNSPWAGHQP